MQNEFRRWRDANAHSIAAFGLALIVMLGAFLRFYELGARSIGNTYYAATVQSMLTSWHNFFFAAFEPGGSVTVDKPPLGFWVQAASAYIFGVNGFALALPQALAGVLSILLLYAMVKRPFGVWAGLSAALVLAVTPVAVSTERNNTIDGLLVFVLLLATWAFLRAARPAQRSRSPEWQPERNRGSSEGEAAGAGRLRYLLLGAFLVGLGFNIKMMQAFLPLPALYACYLLGAPVVWWKRALHLVGATAVLIAVSLSWAMVVDLTPPENRPYVGSSQDNTVMGLIVGHNGLNRLLPGGLRALVGGPAPPWPQKPPSRPGQPGQVPANPPLPPTGNRSGLPPVAGNQPANPPPLPGGSPFNHEIGQPGVWRLFTEPLVTEAGWLLPLALLGILLGLLVLGWRWPPGERHIGLVLWGGWLLTEVVFFSIANLFHAYYLIMLGPPLAALVAIAAWATWQVFRRWRWAGWLLLTLLAGATAAFQIFTLRRYPDYSVWVSGVILAAMIGGLGMLAWAAWQARPGLCKVAVGLSLLSLMVAPLVWSALTAFDRNPDVMLPRAGPGVVPPPRPATLALLSPAEQAILEYTLARTDPDDYLLATLNARDAAPFILATQRPVLAFGGFSGGDNVVDVDKLARMVDEGRLRFVLSTPQLQESKREIAAWLTRHCRAVPVPGLARPGQLNHILIECFGQGGYDNLLLLTSGL